MGWVRASLLICGWIVVAWLNPVADADRARVAGNPSYPVLQQSVNNHFVMSADYTVLYS